MNESCGYKLRSSSPYHKVTPTRKKTIKAVNEDQAIFDSITVKTYNDSPEHMYGLDRKRYDDPSTPPNVSVKASQARKQSQDEAGFMRLFNQGYYDVNGTIQSHENGSQEETIQRLIDQINLQKSYIEEFSNNMKEQQQQQDHQHEQNCSCDDQMNILLHEDSTQKVIMENLQQQILTTIDVVKSMNKRVTNVQEVIKKQEEEQKKKETKSESNDLCQGEDCQFMSQKSQYKSIQSALETYHADVLGLTDFALESVGGSIHSSYHSDTCEIGAPIIKVFGLPLWQDPHSPRTVIHPDNSAGKCWPMKGSEGYIVIKLATPIEVTMFSLEHLDKQLDKYSNRMYQLAPKNFEVYAWLDKDGKVKIKLGSYLYVRENSPIQMFKAQTKFSKPVRLIELRILSNYGNNDCTCLYRFRVHGASYEWDVERL